jgi:hypothetical protein
MSTKVPGAPARQGSVSANTEQHTVWKHFWLRGTWLGAYAMLFGQKIFSSSLLVVQATSITVHDAVFMKSAAFDAGLWNTSFSYGANSIPLWSAIQWEKFTRPSWTGETFVVEPFRLQDHQANVNSTYTAVTKGMYPGLDCDEAKFVRELTYSKDASGFRGASFIYRSRACDTDQNLNLALSPTYPTSE